MTSAIVVDHCWRIIHTLCIQLIILSFQIVVVLLMALIFALHECYVVGSFLQNLCTARLYIRAIKFGDKTNSKYLNQSGGADVGLAFELEYKIEKSHTLTTFSPCKDGTASRRAVKLSFMWSRRLRSSALWCARFSACKYSKHKNWKTSKIPGLRWPIYIGCACKRI